MFYQSIQFIQINIGKNLAGKTANWDSTMIVYSLSLSRASVADGVIGNNFFNKPLRFGISYPTTNNFQKFVLFDVIKKFSNIRPPNKTARIFFKKELRSGQRAGQPFVFPARPNIVSKNFVVNFHQIFIYQPMNHAVAHTNHRDVTSFTVGNGEMSVWAWQIMAIIQIQMEPP